MPHVIKGWPLLGVLPQVIRHPFGFLSQAREQYGDIYTLNLGFSKIIVLTHPRHAQHMLRDHADKYGKGGALWDSMRGLVGNGLIVLCRPATGDLRLVTWNYFQTSLTLMR
jgi:cytochrome P450